MILLNFSFALLLNLLLASCGLSNPISSNTITVLPNIDSVSFNSTDIQNAASCWLNSNDLNFGEWAGDHECTALARLLTTAPGYGKDDNGNFLGGYDYVKQQQKNGIHIPLLAEVKNDLKSCDNLILVGNNFVSSGHTVVVFFTDFKNDTIYYLDQNYDNKPVTLRQIKLSQNENKVYVIQANCKKPISQSCFTTAGISALQILEPPTDTSVPSIDIVDVQPEGEVLSATSTIIFQDDFNSYPSNLPPQGWIMRGEQSVNPLIIETSDRANKAVLFQEVQWEYWDKWLLRENLVLLGSYSVTTKLVFNNDVADRAGITIAWNEENWNRIDIQPNVYTDQIEFRQTYVGNISSNTVVNQVGSIQINSDETYWIRVDAKNLGPGQGEVTVLWSTDGVSFQPVIVAKGIPNLSGLVGISTAGPHMPEVVFDDFLVTDMDSDAQTYESTPINPLLTQTTEIASGQISPVEGAKIAFVSNRDGNWEIYVMNANGTDQTRLTNNQEDDLLPNWSPDGNKIAFMSNRDGNDGIYVMNADGSDQIMLTNYDDSYPVWSPDGQQIAFSSDRDGLKKIYVMDSNGSNQTQITKEDYGHDIDPNWAPDGQKITFISNRDGGEYAIYIMNADGSNQILLSHVSELEYSPHWSPDGKKIGFVSARNGNDEIYVMNMDGSEVTRLTNNQDSDSDPTWSPDEQEILFDSNRNGNWNIYMMNADGSNQTRLTNNSAYDDYQPVWSHPSAINPKCQISSFSASPATPQILTTSISVSASGTCDTGVRAMRIKIDNISIYEIDSDSLTTVWNTPSSEGNHTITVEVAGLNDNNWTYAASQSISFTLQGIDQNNQSLQQVGLFEGNPEGGSQNDKSNSWFCSVFPSFSLCRDTLAAEIYCAPQCVTTARSLRSDMAKWIPPNSENYVTPIDIYNAAQKSIPFTLNGVEQKVRVLNRNDEIQHGDLVYWPVDCGYVPSPGHIGYVDSIQGTSITIIDSNWNKPLSPTVCSTRKGVQIPFLSCMKFISGPKPIEDNEFSNPSTETTSIKPRISIWEWFNQIIKKLAKPIN